MNTFFIWPPAGARRNRVKKRIRLRSDPQFDLFILEDELLPVLMGLVSIRSSSSEKSRFFKIPCVRYLTIQRIFNQSCKHWSDGYIDQHCEAN